MDGGRLRERSKPAGSLSPGMMARGPSIDLGQRCAPERGALSLFVVVHASVARLLARPYLRSARLGSARYALQAVSARNDTRTYVDCREPSGIPFTRPVSSRVLSLVHRPHFDYASFGCALFG